MKSTLLLSLLLFLSPACPAAARDFLPEHWFETLPATDDSSQQCLVFRTTPGILYTVLESNDLQNWTPLSSPIYGLGHEVVVPIREILPAPPLPPGSPPPPAFIPPTHVSLVFRPAAGTAGGTVVSWRSLEGNHSLTFHIEQDLHPDWSTFPLFWQRYGDYYFFIAHFPTETAAPQANPLLGPADSAMMEVLEERIPDMNLEVAASAAVARNTPPPAPPDPSGRKFVRIFSNAQIDSDSDGTPDWAEFELAAAGGPPPPGSPHPDPFNGDTDGDGIPDGAQLDTDGDGVPDLYDSAISDATATFSITPNPRYALFPITNAVPNPGWSSTPLQINDRGTVLYTNGTWNAGTWTTLAGTGQLLKQIHGAMINDHGEIIGAQYYGRVDANDHMVPGNLIYWQNRTAQPVVLSADGEYPWIGGLAQSLPGPSPMGFSNDGQLIAFNQIV